MHQKDEFLYEVGPIRPPNEYDSLFVRITRNCPWNRCAFCSVYKNPQGERERFSIRPTSEVIGDIQVMKKLVDHLGEVGVKLKGELGREVTIKEVWNSMVPEEMDDKTRNSYLDLLRWIGTEKHHAFLQDGDATIVPTSSLETILLTLKSTFPGLDRVTAYARAHSAAKKTVEEFQRLNQAGLTRVHMGLESGSNTILQYIHKGTTAEEIISAGEKIKQAGIGLSLYVILGLGGKKYWEEHATETARVINAINPDFVRLRTLGLGSRKELFTQLDSGAETYFEPMNDDEVVREERLLLSYLSGIQSAFITDDHFTNLLPEVTGNIPKDQGWMLEVIDEYLSLPEAQRKVFRYLRRTDGYFFSLAHLNPESAKYAEAQSRIKEMEQSSPGEFERFMFQQIGRMI
ncbi:MAG: radical SAM protein [Candidatus Woesearchaeota archaeon]|jgi:hypothetical protein